MSGGVDSSVAAVLLKDAGYDVAGITMCFSRSDGERKQGITISGATNRPSCCGIDGINDAKRVAGILGIPHYVLNFAEDMERDVLDNFILEYLSGRTPNPCVRCNQFLKFDALLKKVKSLGADYLATGHYAIIEFNKCNKDYALKKAADRSKDQSYFLYGIKKENLPHILFPLGDKIKKDVREIARKWHLNVAEKKESQDICFVPDRDYKKFVENRVGEKIFKPGNFINQEGKTVGQHQGVAHYTIGQREKLGIALGTPVYIYKMDLLTNTIYVGPQEYLLARGLIAIGLNWLVSDFPKESLELKARIRYNACDVKAQVTKIQNNTVKVVFDEPQKSVTPGQSVVFYDEDIVLGGGIIDEAIL